MSGLRVMLDIDRATSGKAIGIKEAIAMDLEKYGDVRVLWVEVREPEQLGLEGIAPAKPAHPAGQAPSADGGKIPQRAKRGVMACCFNCVNYRQSSGRDEMGQLYWGLCARSGKPVYELKGQCAAWKWKDGTR